MMNKTLYEIGSEFIELENLLEEIGGDVSDAEIEKQIDDFLADLTMQRDKKLDGYASLIVELQSRGEARAAEARRLIDLANDDMEKGRKLQERLKAFFERTNVSKVETFRFKLSVVKNGGKTPVALNAALNFAELPEEYRKVRFDPDKDAIREALEAGEKLDFARLEQRGTHLRIK